MSGSEGFGEERELLEYMIALRAFDSAMAQRNKHWHPSIGEEAVVIGTYSGLRGDDVAVPHYRGAIGVALLRGGDPFQLALNVFGKAGSTTSGHWRGDINPLPGPQLIGMFSGCLGTPTAYAAGAAMTAKMTGSDHVAVSTFGEGTANAGILYESLNLAVMLSLPVVYVCQNNMYATSLSATRSIAGGSIAARAKAFGVEAVNVDGNDVLAVRAAVMAGVQRAREGRGPSLVHAQTYRLGGHFMTDPERYRAKSEVDAWRQRDPIKHLIDRWADSHAPSRDALDALSSQYQQRMQLAVDRAAEANDLDPNVLPESPFAPAGGSERAT